MKINSPSTKPKKKKKKIEKVNKRKGSTQKLQLTRNGEITAEKKGKETQQKTIEENQDTVSSVNIKSQDQLKINLFKILCTVLMILNMSMILLAMALPQQDENTYWLAPEMLKQTTYYDFPMPKEWIAVNEIRHMILPMTRLNSNQRIATKKRIDFDSDAPMEKDYEKNTQKLWKGLRNTDLHKYINIEH